MIKLILYFIFALVTAGNIAFAVANKNLQAAFGWSASLGWLAILIVYEVEKVYYGRKNNQGN
jgi:hypothetical protein